MADFLPGGREIVRHAATRPRGTMRHLRIDGELEGRVLKAAGITGEPVALFIRRALEERCETVLSRGIASRLRGVLGIVRTRRGSVTIEPRRKGH